jgi:hypothetical protein
MRALQAGLCALQLLACSRPSPVLPEVTVVGTDYAFLAPDTVPAGQVAISFKNQGTVLHEVKVIRLRAGFPLASVLPLAMADSAWDAYREPTSGILTARPGMTTPGRLLIDFERGYTYLLVCGFANSDTSSIHSALGMIRAVAVR